MSYRNIFNLKIREVLPAVPGEVAAVREVSALCALVRAVAGVRPRALGQGVGLREGLAARRALAVLVATRSHPPRAPPRQETLAGGACSRTALDLWLVFCS